jgi:hypothetical protein
VPASTNCRKGFTFANLTTSCVAGKDAALLEHTNQCTGWQCRINFNRKNNKLDKNAEIDSLHSSGFPKPEGRYHSEAFFIVPMFFGMPTRTCPVWGGWGGVGRAAIIKRFFKFFRTICNNMKRKDLTNG